MNRTSIDVETLLSYLPDSLLASIAKEEKVNFQVKKLEGSLMFKLLLYSVLSTNKVSLNVLISFFESIQFRIFAKLSPDLSTRRNSLADRLATMQVSYFEKLFESSSSLLEKHLSLSSVNKQIGYRIERFDSTLIACSSKLLSEGMYNGSSKKDGTYALKHIKFSIGFDGLFIKTANFYNQQSYISEDLALGETLKGVSLDKDSVAVIDRGLQSRKIHQELHHQNKCFVIRGKDKIRFKVADTLKTPNNLIKDDLELLDDQLVYLKDQEEKYTNIPLRLVRCKRISDNMVLNFITNVYNLDAFEIATIYRRRWDIEVLFRFLKQEMGFSHLISRNENGIKIMAYVTLIAAMLVLVFKKLNNMKGYKITKFKFAEQLNLILIKELVSYCGGNPNLINNIIDKPK
jgi:Transposase DDE domain